MYVQQPGGEQRRLWQFQGGLHLPDHKAESTGLPIAKATLPPRLLLPLRQHMGAAARPMVDAGDLVLKGQRIAEPQGALSAGLHAPTSGRVLGVQDVPAPHPSGLASTCLVIEPDGRDAWAALPEPWPDYATRSPEELRERIRWAGVVGLGGALFPTSLKLAPGAERLIHTLVVNGAECEPYISCDDLLMREQPERIIAGIRILLHILGAGRCLVAIEDNKPQAIEALYRHSQALAVPGLEIVRIPTLYPSGGERQLIKVLTGQEVPSGGYPADLGILCQNVATVAAVADAVLEGRPLISRILTLTGAGVAQPRNLEVLMGTPVAHLIEQAGGYTPRAARLLLGGPMMGVALASDQVPVTKAANCLLVASTGEAPEPGPPLPCIRCGACARACPANLLPQQLYWYARAKDMKKVREYHLFDCIECGCCSTVCPSQIPLVQYYRFAKTEIRAQDRERDAAQQAKRRHAAREARLERQEAEREARLRKTREDLEQRALAADPQADPKKAAIEAARQRVEAKKRAMAEAGARPANLDHLTPEQQRQKDAADRRRQAAGIHAPAVEREHREQP